MSRRVRAYRTLHMRLLALSLVVVAVSVIATAWLVVRSIGIQQEQSAQTLAKDRAVYRELITWAREHDGWPQVEELALRVGGVHSYRITLATPEGTVVADSSTADGLPSPGRAVVDPAAARTVLDPTMPDPLLAVGLEPTTGPAPDARSEDLVAEAPADAFAAPTAHPTAEAPNEHPTVETTPERPAVEPLLLYITPQDAAASTFFDMSDRNRLRILGIAAAVLLSATAVSLLVGTRMTRPLRALAAAATRMSDGTAGTRVRVTDRGDIGAVAVAFNAMAESRERQEDARKAMVSDVAHELRSPLSTIRGQLEAAQDGLVDLGPELLASLHEEAVTLQRVVDDLQVLALADAGALRLHRERVDLGALARQHVSATRLAASSAVADLTCATSGDPDADVDPVRMRQVLGNLTSNALRHTPAEGWVRIDVIGEDDQVRMRVRDNGSGIPADRLDRVFDRFYRADPSRTRATGGSGLGLAIVRDIVELHGGRVTISSTEGTGTEVVVALPRRADHDSPG